MSTNPLCNSYALIKAVRIVTTRARAGGAQSHSSYLPRSVSMLLRFSPLDCGSGRCRESAECRTALFSSENGQTRFCGKRVGSCAVVQPGPPTSPSVRSMVYPPEEYLRGLTTDRFVPPSAVLTALFGPQLSRRSVILQNSSKLMSSTLRHPDSNRWTAESTRTVATGYFRHP